MTSEQTVSEVQTHQGQLPLSAHSGSNDSTSSASHDGPHDGQDVAHGMGQSKSSRRRRRKRKGKGPDDGAEMSPDGAGESRQEDGGSGGLIPTLQATSSASSSAGGGGAGFNGSNGYTPPNGQQQQHNGAGTGSSATGKRWKKKFRDRERQRPGEGGSISASAQPHPNQPHPNQPYANQPFSPPPAKIFRDANSHQPGNGGGFKRKSGGGGKPQGRGPRSFVGPMDHSYRAVNGNFAETPPSTIEPHGNHGSHGRIRASYQSDSQPIDYSQGRPVPIAEDAPTKIYFFIEDLFFIAKIGETARKLGVKVAFIKNDKESIAALTSHEDEERPGLIVFDLNNANAKPMTLIPKLKAKLKKGTSIVGFLSHLQGDLKAKAVEAGCDSVMPRAAFSQNLPNLLRRYGIADEEEKNFNQ